MAIFFQVTYTKHASLTECAPQLKHLCGEEMVREAYNVLTNYA